MIVSVVLFVSNSRVSLMHSLSLSPVVSSFLSFPVYSRVSLIPFPCLLSCPSPCLSLFHLVSFFLSFPVSYRVCLILCSCLLPCPSPCLSLSTLLSFSFSSSHLPNCGHWCCSLSVELHQMRTSSSQLRLRDVDALEKHFVSFRKSVIWSNQWIRSRNIQLSRPQLLIFFL